MTAPALCQSCANGEHRHWIGYDLSQFCGAALGCKCDVSSNEPLRCLSCGYKDGHHDTCPIGLTAKIAALEQRNANLIERIDELENHCTDLVVCGMRDRIAELMAELSRIPVLVQSALDAYTAATAQGVR